MKQLLCTFVMTTSLMASLNANAGLFDSKPELDCGSESGKKAFTQYVRDDVTSVLQTNYIIAAPVFYKKPLEQFIDTLNGINITISGSRIDSQRSPSDISCTANVSFVVPEKTIDVFKKVPQKLIAIQQGNGYFLNGQLGWKSYVYNLELSDDKKDIVVTDSKGGIFSSALQEATMLAMNHDEEISYYDNTKLNDALERFSTADLELNSLWKSFPDNLRNTMKDAQTKWVNDKTKTCGKVSDAKSAQKNLAERVAILDCQSEITEARIDFLNSH